MFTGTTTMSINTRVVTGAPQQQTIVTINWEGYTPEMAIADLMSGTSPRVAIQARLREEGIPKEMTINASEFHKKRDRVQRPLTNEEITAQALKGTLEQKLKLMEQLRAEIEAPKSE